MNPTYDPAAVEAKWYEIWESSGVFAPEHNPDGEPFCIVLPPPNVTGVLHMGHALDHTIPDVIVRRKRMQGYRTLWLPGTDHAGIATQNVVERQLEDEGLDRHDLGREAFIEQVWQWKARSGNTISQQMRKLGNSVDWGRERFTMDEHSSRAVKEVFVRLYEKGLIYRGNRIINWCPQDHTALSDIEVEYEDTDGELVFINYPFTDGSGHVTVATTRAETMLGDTGVAVHPDDDRYRDAVGKTVLLPLVEREIPVVADTAVDPDFGTGAVKVTPAHDANDFEIGRRAGLETVNIFTIEATVNDNGGRFAGLDRLEAREAVKQALSEEGLIDHIEERQHSVGHCYRCHTVVEPYLSLQWFVKVGPLVTPAIAAVKDGRTRFIPTRWENSYFQWMENLRDWCISRQIWWGHRIPAWYCDDCEEVTVARDVPTQCSSCRGHNIRQDEDVLDTWFSSALWPFSTLGWPDETEDLATFFPNTVMVTGFDIIYFWVARMMKMGLEFMDDVPFFDVVIHGLVRAGDGRKMSKSLGNTIDPLDIIESHGADPLRLAVIQAAAPGQDVPFDLEWVEGTRKFGNKIWNATRFVLGHLESHSVPASGGYPAEPGPEAAWILSRLGEVQGRFDQLLDEYRFSDAYGLLYNFAWSEVFDWYIELSKAALADPAGADETRQTLGVVLRDLLKLFHPAIPFLTEELWSELVGEGLLAGAGWPEVPAVAGSPSMSVFQDLVSSVRQFRSSHQLSPRRHLEMALVDPEGVAEPWWDGQLQSLAAVSVTPGNAPEDDGYTRVVAGPVQGFLSLEGVVDIGAERARIQKALAATQADLAQAEKKLANSDFRDKAPPDVVAKEEAKAAEARATVEKLQPQLDALGGK